MRFLRRLLPKLVPGNAPLLRPARLVRSYTKPTDEEAIKNLIKDQDTLKISPKMAISFTCKVCDLRSHHLMGKHAYTHGTVLIHCPGCKSRHLIADNLDWFDRGKKNIEQILAERGETVDRPGISEFLPEDDKSAGGV